MDVVRWLELALVKGKITPQPLFEFKADRVTNGRLIMIGDAAHMAAPERPQGPTPASSTRQACWPRFPPIHRVLITPSPPMHQAGSNGRGISMHAARRSVVRWSIGRRPIIAWTPE